MSELSNQAEPTPQDYELLEAMRNSMALRKAAEHSCGTYAGYCNLLADDWEKKWRGSILNELATIRSNGSAGNFNTPEMIRREVDASMALSEGDAPCNGNITRRELGDMEQQ